jgi:tetratricopeptide (TPR) repeat protein
LANAGRAEEAQAAVLRALDLEPELRAWDGQRVAADKESYLRDAKQFAMNRLKDAEDSVGAWHLVAEAQFRLGDNAEAERAAREILRLSPGDTRGLMILGRCALARGDTDVALRYFEQFVSERPRDWAALIGRADSHFAAGEMQKARIDFDAALEAARVDWQKSCAQLGRVRVLQALGQIAEAEAAWDAARMLNPRAVDPRSAKAP